MFSNHESIWSSTTSVNDEPNNSVNTKSFKAQNSGNETSVVSTASFTVSSLSNSAWTDPKLSYSSEPNKRDDCSNKSLPSKTDNQLFLVTENKNISASSQDSLKVSLSNLDVTMPSSTVVSVISFISGSLKIKIYLRKVPFFRPFYAILDFRFGLNFKFLSPFIKLKYYTNHYFINLSSFFFIMI